MPGYSYLSGGCFARQLPSDRCRGSTFAARPSNERQVDPRRVGVSVGVAVAVGVSVSVGVGVAVKVLVGVGVSVLVGLSVGVGVIV